MTQFLGETYNTSPTPTNAKSISSHCRQYQLTFFLPQAIIMAEIFHKLVAQLMKGAGAVTVSMYPNIDLDQLEN